MKIPVYIGIVFLITACSTYSPNNERQWIKHYTDTGEFNLKGVREHKAVFVGSKKPTYSNISSIDVKIISSNFLGMLK